MTRSNWLLSWSAALLVVASAGVTPAAAQSQPRVEISANVGVLTATNSFEETRSYASNGGETATITVEHPGKTTVAFNVGAAVRILPKVWVGAQYAVANAKANAPITAVVPHPILFNAPRTAEGEVDDVTHNEGNLHVDVMYALPVSAVDVKVMGGPTFFNVTRDFVSEVALNETYPFDTATFASATKKELSGSAVGFNVGVDISYPLSPRVGVGGLVRYSQGDVKFDNPDTGSHTVKAGGLEAVGGVRIRF